MLYLKLINNNHGIALVLALLLMVILSIIGLSSVMNTATDITISGNVKCSDDSFYAADAAAKQIANKKFISTILKERAVVNNFAFTGISIVDTTNILGEIQGLTNYENDTDAPPSTQTQVQNGGAIISNQDINVNVGNTVARVDIDHLDVTGSYGGSIEAHSSYEGIGASLGSGAAKKLYNISSIVIGTSDCASPTVKTVYKCVLSGGGFCQ